MGEDEAREAMELLADPDLAERVIGTWVLSGWSARRRTCSSAYLAHDPPWPDRPFGVAMQSSSSAGKSTLADAVLMFVPSEDLTSLFSTHRTGPLLPRGGRPCPQGACGRRRTGRTRASYALKLLGLRRPALDRLDGQGPGQSASSAPHLRGRRTGCADLHDDGDRHRPGTCEPAGRAWRERRAGPDPGHPCCPAPSSNAAGSRCEDAARRRIGLHQNAQRLSGAVTVVIPDAEGLSFPDHAIRHRRDQQKLSSISAQRVVAPTPAHRRHYRGRRAHRSLHRSERSRRRARTASCCRRVPHGETELAPQTRRLLSPTAGLADRSS